VDQPPVTGAGWLDDPVFLGDIEEDRADQLAGAVIPDNSPVKAKRVARFQ